MSAEKEERARQRAGVGVDFALLFAAALVLRALALRWFSAEPVWDGHYYDFGARRIASGHGYSEDVIVLGETVRKSWSHYPVGYSAFLGVVYKMFGTTTAVRDAANVIVGSLLAPVTYLAARSSYSVARARVAGALVVVHPGLVLYSVLTMSELSGVLLVMVALVLGVNARAQPSHKRGVGLLVLSALVLGMGALVRPQALLVAPVIAFVALPIPVARSFSRASASIVLYCVFALVPVVPWSVRNCYAMDGCAFVSTNAGWNLAIGSFPRATGRFETLRGTDGCSDVTGQVNQDKCWLHYGIEHIRRDPVRWLKLAPTKLSQTFDHESFAVGYLAEANPTRWPDSMRQLARDLLSNVHRVLVVAAAFGTVVWQRKSRPSGLKFAFVLTAAVLFLRAQPPVFWPLVILAAVMPWFSFRRATGGWRTLREAEPACLVAATLIGTTALTHVVFFGEDRYHIAVTPALCLLSAGFLRPFASPQRRPAPV